MGFLLYIFHPFPLPPSYFHFSWLPRSVVAIFFIYIYCRFLFLLFGTLQNKLQSSGCDQLFSQLLFHLRLFVPTCYPPPGCGCVTLYLRVWCGLLCRQKHLPTGCSDLIPHRNCGCVDIRKPPDEIWRVISSHGDLAQPPSRRRCWPTGPPGGGFWGRFV